MKVMNDKFKELLEASENAIYWGLRSHAADCELGVCEKNSPVPAYIKRLQDAVRSIRRDTDISQPF